VSSRLPVSRVLFVLILGCASFCYGNIFAQSHLIEYADKARIANNEKKQDSAIYYADKAIELSIQQKDTLFRLRAMRWKGKALLSLKKEKESIDVFFQALSLCRSPKYDREMGLLYGEVGYYYYSQGHAKEAKAYYHRNLEVLSRISGWDSLGNQLINLSAIHQMLEEYDSSRMRLDKVREIAYSKNDSSMQAYYQLNMGAYYTVVGYPDSAKACYLEAYKLWKALGNESQLFRATFNLGFYEFQKKNYKEAIRYYHLSEEAAGKYAQKRDLAHVYGTMAESYAALGDYKSAYDYLYKYAILNDSFSKEDINKYARELDRKYQTDKAQQIINEQQLALKQQQNTILWVAIIALVGLALGIGGFVYVTFRSRVRKQVEEAKGRFFANVAHEIRTPLSMIRGPIELLQNKTNDKDVQHQLDIAARNTLRLNDLINQMLDISKIDSAKYKLHEHAGNIRELVNQLFDQYQALAKEKDIALACHCDVEALVYFDKDAFEKILNNLASNAIKYTPSGGSAGIEISSVVNTDTISLSINVWDSGPGIPPSEHEKVFDRFYRASSVRSSTVKGAGIGLSLVKELVTLMSGNISLESAPGKGSVFSVNLPLRTVPSPNNSVVENVGNKPVILLAEDDADILNFNKNLLQSEGYAVIPAENGLIASEAMHTTLPDLVITDLMMPVKGGLELLKQIRSQELTAHIPVIILSAKASQAARTDGVSEGAQVYLAKPFSPAELLGVVRNQLDLLQRYKQRYAQHVANEEKPVEQRFQGADPFMRRCHEIILEHIDDAQFSVEMLAGLMNVNRSHFQRKIKTLTGYSPSEVIKMVRLERAKEMLLNKEGNITETAYATGFTSQSYFTRCFSEYFGYPPSDVHKTVTG
jgi:signal transduction histidine kinase/DNA-binding response OmpR family regulator